jgi:hypothetical protein
LVARCKAIGKLPASKGPTGSYLASLQLASRMLVQLASCDDNRLRQDVPCPQLHVEQVQSKEKSSSNSLSVVP